jgi:hypothetical protein
VAGLPWSLPAEAQTARATIDAGSILRSVEPGKILGGNVAAWVAASRLEAPTDDTIRALGHGVLRFPGGNLSNNYCWTTVRASDNDHVVWDDWSWGTNVDQYLTFVDHLAVEPMYSLNPFDHTIDGVHHSAVDEAVALAREFTSRGYSGAYYEVGNENEGFWNRMLPVEEYTDRFIAIADALKREDASIRMLGPVGGSYTPEWVDAFIDGLAARNRLHLLDFVAYHFYGGWIAADNSNGIDLNSPQRIARETRQVRDRLDALGGVATGIAITEYNAAIWADDTDRAKFSIEQALWLVDVQGELFRHVDLGNVWITLHTGQDPHSLIDDEAVPPTRTRNYWPARMVYDTFGSGAPNAPVDVLGTSSDFDSSQLTLHAVRRADSKIGILVVNKGASAVALSIALEGSGCADVTGALLDEPAYQASRGPAAAAVRCSGTTVAAEIPGRAAIGAVVQPF